MKHVILIGASGFVGSAILEELLNRGHHVTAIVRTPNKLTQSHTNLKVEVMDVEDRNALVQVCHGQDAVISAYNPGWGNPEIYEDTLRVYPLILEAVKAEVPKGNLVGAGYMCQGKMGQRVRKKYEEMLKEDPENRTAQMLIENFDQASSHPDDKDVENLVNWVKACR